MGMEREKAVSGRTAAAVVLLAFACAHCSESREQEIHGLTTQIEAREQLVREAGAELQAERLHNRAQEIEVSAISREGGIALSRANRETEATSAALVAQEIGQHRQAIRAMRDRLQTLAGTAGRAMPPVPAPAIDPSTKSIGTLSELESRKNSQLRSE